MSNQGSEVTTVVIELEPGWIFVKIADPAPEASRLDFFVQRTIDDWFNSRPNAVIEKTERIPREGELLGVHIWYHETKNPPKKIRHTETSSKGSFCIQVHGEVGKKLPREHIEALVDTALQILPSYANREDTLVVISPRRICVILDKTNGKGAVLPLELIEQVINGAMKAKLQEWLASPATPFYVMHIAGSWLGESD